MMTMIVPIYNSDVLSLQKLGIPEVTERIIAYSVGCTPRLARTAQYVICVSAVNLVWMLKNSAAKDRQTTACLRSYIGSILPTHLRSGTYYTGRKLPAILSMAFIRLKNAVRKLKDHPQKSEIPE